MKKKNDNFNKIMASTITASVVASALVTVAPNAHAAATNFKDVQSNDFFYDAVNSLYARNIFSGYNDGTFRPNETVTRAQAAKIIALALNLDTTNTKDPGFKDVSKKDWAYKYIAALANKGIVVGSEGEYKPNNPITRAQMAKVISLAYNFQAENSHQLSFTDVSQDDWFKNYIGALVGNQITFGTTPTTFSPYKNVTRGQIAAFVYRSEYKTNPVQVSETISTITNDTLVTSEGTYILSGEQKKWINPSNLATLKGAILKLTSTDNKIEQIQSIELTTKGTASTDTSNPYANHLVFDGKGATINTNVFINGDYITLKNITIKGDFHIGKGVENSFFSEFTKVEGKTTIDDSSVVAGQSNSSPSSVVKIASTNNFAAAVNETTTRGRIIFSEFQLADVGVDKNADVIFQSKTSGTSTVGEIVVNSNAILTAESSVVLPKVIIGQGATDVTLHSNVTNLQVTASGNVKLSGKSNIVNLSLMANANIDLQTIGRVNNLETVNKETKVTIGTETKIGNLIIPTGSKPADIIGNYNSVKGNVEQVRGTKNPDTITASPSTGNSGGGASDITTPTDTTAPAAVTGLVGSSLDTTGGIQNNISWNANTVSDLSYYEVYRSTNPNGTTGGTKVSSNLAKGVTTFTDTSVVAGTTYYYTVYAVDTSGNRSVSSNVAMVATVNDNPLPIPTEPIGLQVVSPTSLGNDGKITNLDATKVYQYKLNTETEWKYVTESETEITNLSAGTYEVRFAAMENLPASLPAIVTVPSLNQSQAPSNILVMNYARSGEDLIAVPNVPAGSTIKVYDASTNGKLIGSFSANDDNDDIESNAIISISEGFAPDLDKVYVTITENGKSESERVEKEVPTTFPDAPVLSDIAVTENPNGDVRVTVKVPSPTEDSDSQISVYDVLGKQLPGYHIDNGLNSIVIPNDYVNGMSEIDVAILKIIGDGTQFVESFRTRVNISQIQILNIEAAADTQGNDKTVITVGDDPSQGNEFAYKVFNDVDAANDARPTLNADVTSWEVLPQDGKISASNGNVVVVVERTTVGKLAKKVGQVNAVAGAVNPLLEAVMIDGKDGVSSQDGKVETVRLKFSEKFKPETVLADDMFSVDGFTVESIQVTDKNGRTPKLSNGNDNPLYTQGESQYITIRVEQKDGTDFTPQVTQKANSSFTDINGVNITGIDIQAKDQASPVIISSEFMDKEPNGVNAGDQVTIKFSEDVKLISDNLTDLVDDFAISNHDNVNFTFANDDSFELNGDTVTVTLGSATVSKMEQKTTITMNTDGTISLADIASTSNKAKPQKEYVNETVYSTAITIDITNIPAPNLNPPARPTASKALGTGGGTVKLTGLTDGFTYQYIVDNNETISVDPDWTVANLITLSGTTEIDNIDVNAGQYVHIRVAKIGMQPASDAQDLAIIELSDIKPAAKPNVVTVVDSAGSTKTRLTGLNSEEIYEYFVDENPKATDNSTKWSDNNPIYNSTSSLIEANSSQYIHIRVKKTEKKPASEIADIEGRGQIQDSPTQ